jgi:repressor LexA
MVGAHIVDGDIVILEIREPRPGEVVAALIDGETTLKRLVMEGGSAFLRAENPRYPDLTPLEELTVQGVVRAVIRRVEGAAA